MGPGHRGAATAKQLGLDFVRAATPGTDPRFVAMVRELVPERIDPADARCAAASVRCPVWDTCPGRLLRAGPAALTS